MGKGETYENNDYRSGGLVYRTGVENDIILYRK